LLTSDAEDMRRLLGNHVRDVTIPTV
jgi:hypothetical protein